MLPKISSIIPLEQDNSGETTQRQEDQQSRRADMESVGECEQSKHGECRREDSVGQLVRGNVADGRLHCRCCLRSLEYCRVAKPTGGLASNTQQDPAVSARTLLG